MVKDNSYGIAPLQDKMLDILKHFISVCEENGLRYCACGGTCIGALRHQGFIPWDDDLDVYMPRPDYEKLWQIYDNSAEPKFKLCRTTSEKNYHHRVMQMVDVETTFINKRSQNEDIEHGVYIDIIPLDACPSNPLKRVWQIYNSVVFSVYNIACLPELHGGKTMRLAVKVMLALVRNPKRRYNIWKKAEKRMQCAVWGTTERIVELASSFKTLRTPYPKNWFQFGGRMERFEGIYVCVPDRAEEYLTLVFGNYMTLPSKAERLPRHNTVLLDLDHSYTSYKGVFYCVNKAKENDAKV